MTVEIAVREVIGNTTGGAHDNCAGDKNAQHGHRGLTLIGKHDTP